MLVHNVTVKVDAKIADEWLRWQLDEHIPAVMATNLFAGNHFFKLLEQDDSDGPTYVFQYLTDSIDKYNTFMNDHAPSLLQKSFNKWGDRFVVFRTLLQTVH